MRFSFRSRYDAAAICACLLALIWMVSRACIQSITVDEADMYLGFVQPAWPSHWYPSSGNHVLQSALIRLLIYFFGLSQFIVRAPSLLGAIFYVFAAYRICHMIFESAAFRLAVLLCLIYDPFIMDYLVASRGYALALGFLMLAVLSMAVHFVKDPPLTRRPFERLGWAAAWMGLSLSANFSFAYIDAFLLFSFGAAVCWQEWRENPERRILSLAKVGAACILPFAGVVLLACGSVLLEFPRSQIYYGAESIRAAWDSVVDSVFFEINPYLANPLVVRILQVLRPHMATLFCLLAVGNLAIAGWSRAWRKDGRLRGLALLELVIFGGLLLALATHWLAFHILHLPLPNDRTAIFTVPLALLIFGLASELTRTVRLGQVMRVAALCVLWTGTIFFAACLRIDYFKEWKFDADVKSAYWALDNLRRRYGITQSCVHWEFLGSLNFYRILYEDNKMAFVPSDVDKFPAGYCSYVLRSSFDDETIKREHLSIFYRGPHEHLLIAIRDDDKCKLPDTGR